MNFKKTYNNELKEYLYEAESQNGLKVFYIPKLDYNKQFAIFSTDYGSINNIFKADGKDDYKKYPEGIAHFLEHKLFEEKDGNIFDEYSKLGISVNAFTSFTQTSYLFTSTDNFYKGLELLVKFVQNPYLTEENIEKEKGIIEQEIKMYQDDPSWVVYFNLLDNLYIKHPVKIDIAGTVKSVNSIEKKDLIEAYNTFYNPLNMVLCIVGDLSFNKIMDVINKVERQYKNLAYIDLKIVKEPKKIKRKISRQKMSVSSPIYNIGFKDINMDYMGDKKIKKDIAINILLDGIFGRSSKFYNKFYEKEIIDSSFGAYYTGGDGFGHSIIYGEGEEAELIYKEILKYLKKPLEDIFTIKDFERIKNKTIGQFFMGLNSIESIGTSFVSLYFQDSNIFNFINIIKDISYEDIEGIYNSYFTKELSSISIIESIS